MTERREGPGRGDRGRRQLRARRVAGLGSGDRQRPGCRRATTSCRLTIDPHGTWLDARRAPDRADRRQSRAPQLRRGRPRRARSARRGRHAGRAVRPGRPAATSAPACGAGALAMDKWVTKLVADAVGVATAPGSCSRRPARRRTVDAPGGGQARRRRLEPRRQHWSREPAELGPAARRGVRPRPPGAGRGPRGRPRDRPRRPRPPGRRAGRRPGARDRRRRRLRLRRQVRRRAPTSGSRPPWTRRLRRSSRTPPSRCTTPWAAPASPGSTSSSPKRAGAQRGEHDARLHRGTRRCRRCSRPPASTYADLLDLLVQRRAALSVVR